MTKDLIVLLGRDPRKTCINCTNIDLEGPFCSDSSGTMEINAKYYCKDFKKQSFIEKFKRRYYLYKMRDEYRGH